jgi:hypothetical protein
VSDRIRSIESTLAANNRPVAVGDATENSDGDLGSLGELIDREPAALARAAQICSDAGRVTRLVLSCAAGTVHQDRSGQSVTYVLGMKPSLD